MRRVYFAGRLMLLPTVAIQHNTGGVRVTLAWLYWNLEL